MNLNDLRAFVAVAETGSVSRAASRLHLTQPALTRRVQNLEAHLRATLLDRTTKPPTLTPTGYRVLDHGRHVLLALTELEDTCRGVGDVVGPLRLGVAHGLAECVLAEPLAELQRTFPKLGLFVRAGWTKELLEGLGRASLDGVVGLLPPDRPALSFPLETLGQEKVVVVAPRNWAGSDHAGLMDLRDASWVLNPKGCSYRTALEEAFDRQGVAVRVSMEVLGRELQLSLVARGAGLGFCPVKGLRASPQASEVRILRTPGLSFQVDIACIRAPGTSHLARAFTVFSQQVGQALQAGGADEH